MTDTASPSSTPPADSSDPRGGLFKAVDLVGETLAALKPEQYDVITPCPDFSVRDLANHLVSVLRRLTVMGTGGSFMSHPHFAPDVADGAWAEAWAESRAEFDAVWSDPAVLAREIGLPWGPVPGAAASVIYTNELVLHVWDLAKATGQSPEWDPEMLAAPLAHMHRAVPAEPRGNPVPFGPVVEVPRDAPAIDRLVGWYGRRP
ncbi:MULTISPECIES: TIGR03086 family metal-binding protein [unclassified Streptomyces]|uniref:TIGR03086 family metal-binding protein n=1 Tax=unclassified Streptomyces TaxID=2593676 RepID=UPI00166097D6|nr:MULTISPECIES: TIGR03086 family metal-binding protein [unclassified Streptomyces]MBD0707891.1 TIGR03086 family protein [Streptomyces sp. CBMA291]MBD0717592.1 TIGR03086 family protein [Streptomyces sp. CBMA370]